jgi:PAS domain S-box-containing protein
MKHSLTASQELNKEEILRKFNIESVPDAVSASDKNGTIIFWNKASEKLYGFTKDEVLGKNSWEITHARLLNCTIEEYKKSLKAHGKWSGEAIQYHKNGTRIFVSSHVQSVKDSKGTIIGRIGFNRDITHHKYVEYNLRFLSSSAKTLSSSLDYQTTLNRAAHLAVPRIADWCGIDLINDKGEIEQVAIVHRDPKKVKWAIALRNKYPPDMSTNQGLPKVLKTGKSEFVPFIPEEVLQKASVDKERMQIIKKIGFTGYIIVPITTSHSKKPIGAISMVSAESRRIYTPADLQTAEKLASQASFAIENARLYRNAEKEIVERKMAEEKMREMESKKDNFISMASHELKTPITSLKIYADLLERQLSKENIKKFDKTILVMKNQMNKINQLIIDLLNLSKIQAGKLELRMDTFDFTDLLYEIIEQIQPTTHHTIECKIRPHIRVFGDRDRIGQVLINLLTNAIKYSLEEKRITINVISDKLEVQVRVRDYGVGIKEEHRKKIFERFYQIGSGDKTYPGLGMGLYISHEIITRHQGTIWVEKARGKGSVFIFTLPKKR